MASSENIQQKLINSELARLMDDLILCGDNVDELDEILSDKHLDFNTIEKLQYIIFAAERVLDKLQDLMKDSEPSALHPHYYPHVKDG